MLMTLAAKEVYTRPREYKYATVPSKRTVAPGRVSVSNNSRRPPANRFVETTPTKSPSNPRAYKLSLFILISLVENESTNN
jgi:hypothetical protein